MMNNNMVEPIFTSICTSLTLIFMTISNYLYYSNVMSKLDDIQQENKRISDQNNHMIRRLAT